MRSIYNFLTQVSTVFVGFSKHFSPKMRLFVDGRKTVFKQLNTELDPTDKTVWIHCASLGEYEQGVPIIKSIKATYPHLKLVITFYSPSGYEVKKTDPLGEVVVYLPLDTHQNANRFLDLVRPSLAVFVKYEFWPNYLLELERRNIPALLVSGVFRKQQLFFKFYGGFMRRALKTIDHFFVQDKNSEALLTQLGLQNVTRSGDTRFDRVSQQIEKDNRLNFVDRFLNSQLCIVCGSTWPEDEAFLIPFINKASSSTQFIIAPHIIDPQKIEALRSQLKTSSLLYSELKEDTPMRAQVLIVDAIGFLSKIYSYADIAYVGGAAGNTGLHNILEPATFGVPIVVGPHIDHFPEAIRLRQLAGLFTVGNANECEEILQKLSKEKTFRTKTGLICEHFVNSNTGATRMIMEHIHESYRDRLV